MRRSTCRHCGKLMVKLPLSKWVHEGTLAVHCDDGKRGEPR